MPVLPRDGDDQRIISQFDLSRAPWRHHRHSVGPADPDKSLVGGLQSVSATPHPVVRIAQADASDAMFTSQDHCARHAHVSGPKPDAPFGIPLLDRARRDQPRWLGVFVNTSALDAFDKTGKTIQPVRKYAVPLILREKPGNQ